LEVPVFLHVERFVFLGRYRLRIRFTNGEEHVVDLEHELDGDVFEALRDQRYFASARLNEETGTIEWPNGADLAPEFLYELATKRSAVESPR
jgi:hypothetical protein